MKDGVRAYATPDNVRFSLTNGLTILERRSAVTGPSHLVDSWVTFDAPHAQPSAESADPQVMHELGNSSFKRSLFGLC